MSRPEAKLALFQYIQKEGEASPRWHRRCEDVTFELNTEFRVSQSSSSGCGNGVVYYRDVSSRYGYYEGRSLDSCNAFKNFRREIEDAGSEDPLISGAKQSDQKFLILHPLVDPLMDSSMQQSSWLEVATGDNFLDERCQTRFPTETSRTFYAWKPIFTGYGVAWLQRSGYFDQEAEVHVMRSFPMDRNGTCASLVVDFFDLSSFTEAEYASIPFMYNYQDQSFYCRFTRSGRCILRVKNHRELASVPRDVYLSDERAELASLRMDVLDKYLFLVREAAKQDGEPLLNSLQIWEADDDEPGHIFKRVFPRLPTGEGMDEAPEVALRFADLKLFLDSDANLTSFWLKSMAGGWQLKQHLIERSESPEGE